MWAGLDYIWRHSVIAEHCMPVFYLEGLSVGWKTALRARTLCGLIYYLFQYFLVIPESKVSKKDTNNYLLRIVTTFHDNEHYE